MAKIKNILEIDLTKIESESLKKYIKDIIEEYESADNKTAFEGSEIENINMIYNMVLKHSPEAVNSPGEKEEKKPLESSKDIKSSEKESKPSKKQKAFEGKMAKILIAVIGDFKGVLDELKMVDVAKADYVFLLEMTEKLEEAIESGDKEKVQAALLEELEPFKKWLDRIKERDAFDNEEFEKKATASVNELLKELEMPLLNKEKEEVTLRSLTRSAMNKFKVWSNHITGTDALLYADVYGLLMLAYEEEKESGFIYKLREAIDDFNSIKILDVDIQSKATKIINQLDKELSKEEKARKKDNTTSKPSTQEYEEIKKELEECRQEDHKQEMNSSKPIPKELPSEKLESESKGKEQAKEKDPKEDQEKKKQPPKKSPTNEDKIIRHISSLIDCMPESLKENAQVQLQTKSALLKFHRQVFVDAWSMNQTRADNIEAVIVEKFESMVSKVLIGRKNYDAIIVDEHGSAYAMVEDELYVAPLFKNGTIDIDKFGLVEESPNHFKKEMGRILENLGMKNQNKREAFLSRLHFGSNKKPDNK